MALLKTEVPRLAGQGTNQKIEGLRRYLEELQRSLDFVLQNLGEENFNGRALRLPVLTADGARSLGTLGETEGGVGLACGDKGLRVTEAGAEISDDGTVWETLATARALRELTAADVGARPDTWMPTAAEVGAVPTSRTVNGKALSSNITLSASDVGAVPTSRTVNGKALSGNITLSAADVGAVAKTGDTMTGVLTHSNTSDVVKATGITQGSPPSGSNYWGPGHYIRDNDNNLIGAFRPFYYTDGRLGVALVNTRNVNGSPAENYLRLSMDASGNRSVQVSNAAAWRTALGIDGAFYDSGTYTVSARCFGFITSSGTFASLNFVLPKIILPGLSITVTAITGAAIRCGGSYLVSNTATLTSYIVSVSANGQIVYVPMTKSDGFGVSSNYACAGVATVTFKLA